MARAALRIGMRELAERAYTSAPTVCRFENGKNVCWSIVGSIREALEEAGVVFIGTSSRRGAGIRLKHS